MRENFKTPTEKTLINRSNAVASGDIPPFRGQGVKLLTKSCIQMFAGTDANSSEFSPSIDGGMPEGKGVIFCLNFGTAFIKTFCL